MGTIWIVTVSEAIVVFVDIVVAARFLQEARRDTVAIGIVTVDKSILVVVCAVDTSRFAADTNWVDGALCIVAVDPPIHIVVYAIVAVFLAGGKVSAVGVEAIDKAIGVIVGTVVAK